MSEKDYLDKLDSMIEWYSMKSSFWNKNYRTYTIYELIATYLTPVFIFFSLVFSIETFSSGNLDLQFLIAAFCSSLASIFLNKYIQSMGFQKKAQECLKYSTKLGKEKNLYAIKVSPYNVEEPFNLLVVNTEEILESEAK